ncbi:uncharacterized protein LOC125025297 [Penaeus chinensis]|uniref:uncharacterized protein LOC125025297 n=1 Tax=Penaeus chinensis TaxID=139456 RepID=UPI001FB5D334|nr:uncharacterized protein LOC125025297 [Penaeus chinensis]
MQCDAPLRLALNYDGGWVRAEASFYLFLGGLGKVGDRSPTLLTTPRTECCGSWVSGVFISTFFDIRLVPMISSLIENIISVIFLVSKCFWYCCQFVYIPAPGTLPCKTSTKAQRKQGYLVGAMEENSEDRGQSSNQEAASTSWRRNVLPGERSRNADESPDDPDNSDEEIPAGIQCAVCLRKYNTLERRPTILTHCGHTFCRKCLETEDSLGFFKCPTCRQQDDRFWRLPTNYAVMSLLEMHLAKGAKKREEKKEADKSNESSDLPSPYVPRPPVRNSALAENTQAERSKRTESYTQRQEYRRYGSYGLDLDSAKDRSLRGEYLRTATGLPKQRQEGLDGARLRDFSGRLSTDRSRSEYRPCGRYRDFKNLEPRQETYAGARLRPDVWSSRRSLEHRRYGEYEDELSKDSNEDIAPYAYTRNATTRSNRFLLTGTERAKLRLEGKGRTPSLTSRRADLLSSEDSSDDGLLGACGGTTRHNRRKGLSSDESLDLSEDLPLSKGKWRKEAEKEGGLRKRFQWHDQYGWMHLLLVGPGRWSSSPGSNHSHLQPTSVVVGSRAVPGRPSSSYSGSASGITVPVLDPLISEKPPTLIEGKGSQYDCSCYSIPGKDFAHILLKWIRDHLLRHQRLEQSEFTPGKSTIHCILEFRVIMEFGCGLFAAYIDLKNAFDSLHRKTIWKILRLRGIPT